MKGTIVKIFALITTIYSVILCTQSLETPEKEEDSCYGRDFVIENLTKVKFVPRRVEGGF